MEEMCNCIALYSRKGMSINLGSSIEYLSNFISSEGHHFDRIAIDGKKDKSFEVGMKSLSNKKYKSVKSVDLFKTRPDYKRLIFGWDIFSCIYVDQGIFSFCLNTQLFDLSIEQRIAIIKEITSLSDVCYGYTYKRAREKGPDIYAMGMSTGLGFADGDMEERDSIGRWFRDLNSEQSYLTGRFRTVQEVNVINSSHLDSKVSGKTIMHTIETCSDYGRLEQINESTYLWLVAKEHLGTVNAALSESKLLV